MIAVADQRDRIGRARAGGGLVDLLEEVFRPAVLDAQGNFTTPAGCQVADTHATFDGARAVTFGFD